MYIWILDCNFTNYNFRKTLDFGLKTTIYITIGVRFDVFLKFNICLNL